MAASILPGAATPLAHAAGAAEIEVAGQVLRLADHSDGQAYRLLLDDDTRVPVTGSPWASVTPGSVVRARLRAPAGPAGAIRSGDGAQATAVLASAAESGDSLTASSVEVVTEAATSYTAGVHDVTIARVIPAGLRAGANSEASVRAQAAAASAYWSEQSQGGVTFRVASVSAPYTSTLSCSDDPFDLWAEAAARTGFVSGPNKHLLVSLPQDATGAGCSYGLGTVGGGVNSGGFVYVADTAWPVLAHELGHNLGMDHASALRCPTAADTSLTALPSGCSVVEYGDPWDVMAASAPNAAGSLSTSQAYAKGLLDSSAYAVVSNGARTLTLSPVSSQAGLRSVRVSDPRTGEVYVVELRTRSGRDYLLYANMTPGVRVVRERQRYAGSRSTVALDPSPTGSSLDASRHLPAGQRFTSYSGGVVVQVQSSSSASATVVAASLGTGAQLNLRPAPAPVAMDACGTDHDTYVVPSASGVRYLVDGVETPAGSHPAVGVVAVRAEATGVTAIAGASSWSLAFSAAPCRAALSPPSPSGPVAATASAEVSWSGAGASAAVGPMRFDVRVRALTAGPQGALTASAPQTWHSRTTLTRDALKGRFGAMYQVAVRAVDPFDSESEWTDWRTVTMATDERAAGSSWSGAWVSGRSSAYLGGTYSLTSSRRATWSRRATYADVITVMGARHPRGSKAAVYVDGRLVQTIDTYSRTTLLRQPLASIRAQLGAHSVAVVNLATPGRPTLILDGVSYQRLDRPASATARSAAALPASARG